MIRDKIILWDGRSARLEIFTDLTRYEAQRDSVLKADHVLLECAALLLSAPSLEAAIEGVLENLGRFYRADSAYFARVQEPHTICIAPRDWCAPGIQAPGHAAAPADTASWIRTLKERRVAVFHELEQLRSLAPSKYAALQAQGSTSFAAVALLDDSHLVGYIGLDNPRRNLNSTTMLQSLSYFLHSEISKRRTQKLQAFTAEHDTLTGLLNWKSYTRVLTHMKPEAMSSLGILTADINHLYLVNQEYGYSCGDSLILSLAGLLREEFSEQPIFRTGGGTFVVLCQDICCEAFWSRAEHLRQTLHRLHPGGVALGCSWADEDIRPNLVLNIAREFLAVEKGQSLTGPLWEARLQETSLCQLKQALQDGCFHVYLQPKAETQSGRICGAEALVRYQDERHGVVPPTRFIPQLEAKNAVRHIDFFVMEQVCATLQAWKQHGHASFPISFNISRSTLMEPDIVSQINAIAGRYGVDHSLLEIEITEGMSRMGAQMLAAVCRRLSGAGYHLLLDDFGTDYSNLSILSLLPLYGLKFDKSLINGLNCNPKSFLLVKTLIRACDEMHLVSVAEGVEDPEQLELLRGLGCTCIQGYLLNKPLPLAEFERRYLPTSGKFKTPYP